MLFLFVAAGVFEQVDNDLTKAILLFAPPLIILQAQSLPIA